MRTGSNPNLSICSNVGGSNVGGSKKGLLKINPRRMYQNFSLIKQNLSKVDPKSDHKFKKAVGLSLCKYCFDIINESLKTVSGGRADINNWNPEIFNGNIDDTTLNTEDSVKRNFMDVHHIFNENVSSNLGRKPGELLSKLKIFKNISGVYKTNMEQKSYAPILKTAAETLCHGVFNAVTLLPTLFLDISKYQDTLLFNDRDRVQFQLADLISKSDSTDDNVEYNELLSFSQTCSLDDIRAIKEVIDSNIKVLDSNNDNESNSVLLLQLKKQLKKQLKEQCPEWVAKCEIENTINELKKSGGELKKDYESLIKLDALKHVKGVLGKHKFNLYEFDLDKFKETIEEIKNSNSSSNLREKINDLGEFVKFRDNKKTSQNLYNYSKRNIEVIVDLDLQKEAGGLIFFGMFLGST